MLINLHRLIRYAFIEACLIGIFSALAALLLENGIGWLGGYPILRGIAQKRPHEGNVEFSNSAIQNLVEYLSRVGLT